jgi:hypothetical protein
MITHWRNTERCACGLRPENAAHSVACSAETFIRLADILSGWGCRVCLVAAAVEHRASSKEGAVMFPFLAPPRGHHVGDDVVVAADNPARASGPAGPHEAERGDA